MQPLAVLSSVLCVFAALPAGAAVIYSGPIQLAIPFGFDGLYLNPATGSTAPNEASEPVINLFFGGTGIATNDLLRPVISGSDQVANLTMSALVDGGNSFPAGYNGSSTHVGAALNQFQIDTPGHLGFAMQTTTGGPVYYGWMQVVISNAGAGKVIDWAYENVAGNSIAVGAIPEATSMTLTMMVVAGMALRRRR